MSDVCKSCRAPIEWARTVKGHRIPLDPGAVEDGNLTLERGVARARLPDDTGPARRSHFASCAHAAQHRRARAR